ncbi:MAG: RidA family protein [Pyrinomonadaceae bacterium]|nr:RidA family protein [Pyrinomonadaceae bacterium]
MAITLCLIAFGFSASAFGQQKGYRALNPKTLPPAHGYSHVVVAPVGQLVVISGQVAMDSKGEIVGKGDFKAQCTQVFDNIREALASVGLTFKDVIRTDMFVTDMSHLADLRECRTHYLPEKDPPAANLFQVVSLFRPELMIEVTVEAVIPQRTKKRK